SVNFDLTVPYELGNVMFADQIAIRGLNSQRFSDAGDSGSAILERDTNNVVGLLFAGATNGNLTFANHIADVLAKLKIKFSVRPWPQVAIRAAATRSTAMATFEQLLAVKRRHSPTLLRQAGVCGVDVE